MEAMSSLRVLRRESNNSLTPLEVRLFVDSL
jgi:hypothetical protein